MTARPESDKTPFAAQNRADYSQRSLNCNAARASVPSAGPHPQGTGNNPLACPAQLPSLWLAAQQKAPRMAKSGRRQPSRPPGSAKSAPPRRRSRAAPPAGPRDESALGRIAEALETIAARAAGSSGTMTQPAFDAADAFVWQPPAHLAPVKRVNRVDLGLLRGIDRVRDILIENTERFAGGLPANNALLWGARGMGKSSLVKAAHANIAARMKSGSGLKLVEIHREDIETLPQLMTLLRASRHRFIVFCDDLSFDGGDTSYKSLKAALEGGIEGRPDNVILYATSNRRHLLPREMMENERSTAINPGEAVEEKVSLSDRFGLWLGFHRCSQDEYLAMVDGYCDHFAIAALREALHAEALEWATTRGSRSGRVAWQFVQDLAGRLGVRLKPSA
jgi:predicted AAA+ superfamily ATPase